MFQRKFALLTVALTAALAVSVAAEAKSLRLLTWGGYAPKDVIEDFKKETGITVNEYTNLARRERLKELTKNPDYTRKQLARFCGLRSERQVIRLLKQTAS